MKRRLRSQSKSWRLAIGIFAVGMVGYLSVQFLPRIFAPSPLQESSSRTMKPPTFALSPPQPHAYRPSESAARVYVDPETGEFREPPAGAVFDETPSLVVEEATRQSFEDEPLEFMSPVAGGGVITKVRLRFRRPLLATKDANGNLKIQHMPQAADLRGQ